MPIDSDIVIAIREGKIEQLQNLLETRKQQIEANAKQVDTKTPILDHPISEGEETGQTLLYIAATSGQLTIMDYLIKNGATLDCQNSNADPSTLTPLSPIFGAIKAKQKNALMYLVNVAKQNPETIIIRKKDKPHLQFFQLTPLEYAAQLQNTDAVDFLLSAGVDPANLLKYQPPKRQKPLTGDIDPLFSATTVLHNLVAHNDLNGLRMIDDQAIRLFPDRPINFRVIDSKRNTLLHSSYSNEMTQFLLNKNLDVNALNKDGDTPIHAVICTLYDGTEGSIELLSQKADLTLRSKNKRACSGFENYTPLFLAAFLGVPKLVRSLLDAGADIKNTAQDSAKNSPLIAAVSEAKGDENKLATARMLLEAGIDPNAINTDGMTALTTALEEADLVLIRLLLDYGADPNLSLDSNAVKFLFLNEKAVTSMKDEEQDSARANCFQLLIKYGANVNQFTRDELTTISQNSPEAFKILVDCQTLEEFCKTKNIPKIRQLLAEKPYLSGLILSNGDTLMHFTLKLAKEKPDSQELLSLMKIVSNNKELKSIKNKDNQTPIEYAQQNDLHEYLKLLTSLLDRQLNQVLFNDEKVFTLLQSFLSGVTAFNERSVTPDEFRSFITELSTKAGVKNISESLRNVFIQKLEMIHSFLHSTQLPIEGNTLNKLYKLVDNSQAIYQERQQSEFLPARLFSKKENYMLLAALHNLNQVIISQVNVLKREAKEGSSELQPSAIAKTKKRGGEVSEREDPSKLTRETPTTPLYPNPFALHAPSRKVEKRSTKGESETEEQEKKKGRLSPRRNKS